MGLSQLRTLALGGHDHINDLTPIAALPRLRRLTLVDVSDDTDLGPLAVMRNLTIGMYEDQQTHGMERLHSSTRIERWPRND